MRNKILLIIAIVLAALLIIMFLSSCYQNEYTIKSQEMSDRFKVVASYNNSYIVVDTETNVCYYKEEKKTSGYEGYGFMTVLLNSGGTPILWVENEEE